MNERLSEKDKELRATPTVLLKVAFIVNGERRDDCFRACLLFGTFGLLAILRLEWSYWLLLLPAALGIVSFLCHTNKLNISSELKRRGKEPGGPETWRVSTPEEVEEGKRRLKFMKSNKELIAQTAAEYMADHPDESPDDVVDFVAEKCFHEHEMARMEAEIAQGKWGPMAELSRDEDERPLGTLTYDEASCYFTQYCELMQRGCGMREKESILPTSFERMKEALKVECLNWCNHGRDFGESCEFISTGYSMLAQFLPDELAEQASLERAESDDVEVLRVYREAARAADEFSERRMNELNAEWNEFQERFHNKYDS